MDHNWYGGGLGPTLSQYAISQRLFETHQSVAEESHGSHMTYPKPRTNIAVVNDCGMVFEDRQAQRIKQSMEPA